MNRKQMIDYINNNILPQCHDKDYWFSYGREMMKEIIKKISGWRLGKNINIEMISRVDDGVLYINGDCLGRIEPKATRAAFNEESYCTEGKILARQEQYFD